MKVLFFSFVFLLVENVVKNSAKYDVKTILAVRGISEIVKSHYVKNSINFDIILYGEKLNELNNVVNKIIIVCQKLISVKVIRLDINSSNDQFKLTQSAILFFASHTSSVNFNKKVKLANDFTKPLTFLAYYAKVLTEPIQVFEITRFQFNLVYDIEGSFHLIKDFWYKPNFCFKVHWESINRFSPKTR